MRYDLSNKINNLLKDNKIIFSKADINEIDDFILPAVTNNDIHK